MPILKRVELRYRGGTNTNTWFQFFETDDYGAIVAHYATQNIEVVGSPTDVDVTYPVSPVEPSNSGAGVTRVADTAERDALDTTNFTNGHRVIYPNNSVEYWYDGAWSTDTGIGDLQIN